MGGVRVRAYDISHEGRQGTVKRTKKQERAALERALLRALRATGLLTAGELTKELQAELYGLEKARRRAC